VFDWVEIVVRVGDFESGVDEGAEGAAHAAGELEVGMMGHFWLFDLSAKEVRHFRAIRRTRAGGALLSDSEEDFYRLWFLCRGKSLARIWIVAPDAIAAGVRGEFLALAR